MVEGVDEIANIAVKFYKGLLGENTVVKKCDLNDFVKHKLGDDKIEWLARPVSHEEIKKALFSISGDKSPGPDSYNADFYKNSWPLIGEEVSSAISSFFDKTYMPPYVNSIALALIPKVKNADDIKQFRLISCCNVIYKAVSKVLSNRQAVVLPDLVSMNQTAFVKGRHIGDGVLMGHELLSKYKLKGVSLRCAIQIDLMKAFDSVEWSFILDAMRVMKFHDVYVKWIEACFISSRLSVKINGSLSGYFPAKMGFRHGDPISPFLFVLSMEILSGMFDRAVARGVFHLHPQCKGTLLKHLSFADDLLVFTKANVEAIEVIKSILNEFKEVSGLQFNPEKSKIYLARVDTDAVEDITVASGFCRGELPFRYLGVPLTTGKLRRVDCRALLDKITKRITDWRAKKLSYAGKIQLLNLVIHGILQFWMASFILPSDLIKDIENIYNRFLWGKYEGGRSKVAWDIVASPKSEGGVGIRDLRSWNQANVVRHIWKILLKAGSLWVAWLYCYRIKRSSFWTVTSDAGSWHWKRLLKLRGCVSQYIDHDDEGELTWNGKYVKKLKVGMIWEDIRHKKLVVDWYKCVWSGYDIPRRSMVAWLIVKNRITTRDKVKTWDPLVDALCALCEKEEESRDHLFVHCSFTKSLLDYFFIGITFTSFGDMIKSVCSFGESGTNKARKLLWRVLICNIWKERCNHFFGGVDYRSSSHVLEDIKSEMLNFALW
ncbi:LINE-1 retrotransposable element ORF2 protein [Linum perenne]